MIFLSIDFDYFVREKVLWDWGHSEYQESLAMFSNVIWPIRYGSIDIFKETDPKTYADFQPLEILEKLHNKGLTINHTTKLGVAESHEKAYPFFVNGGSPHLLIHFDAHHDLYSKGELNCGNWVYHMAKKYPQLKVLFVYPKWAKDEHLSTAKEDISEEILKDVDIKYITYEQLPILNQYIDKIFICRSGVWVPVHFDPTFETMVRLIASSGILTKNITDYGIIKRDVVTKKEAKEIYEESQKSFKRLSRRAKNERSVN